MSLKLALVFGECLGECWVLSDDDDDDDDDEDEEEELYWDAKVLRQSNSRYLEEKQKRWVMTDN